jgi:hypothetical protein
MWKTIQAAGLCFPIMGCVWAADPLTQESLAKRCDPRALRYVSPLVTAKTEGQGADVEADVRGTPYITLIVTDGGDSYACDHSDWLDARFTGPFGEKRLAQMSWVHEQCGWNSSAKNKSVAGKGLKVLGKDYADGIGTHSPGLLVFQVPDGAEKLVARAALDDSGVKQGNPGPSSVQFIVYAGIPSLDFLKALRLASVPDPAARERVEALMKKHGAGVAKEYLLLQRELTQKPKAHSGIADEATRVEQTANRNAALLPGDRDPLDIVLRRTRALYEDLKAQTDLATAGEQLAALEKSARPVKEDDDDSRLELFKQAQALRRTIALANPLLKPISKLLFITREALPPDEFNFGNHMCDQYFGFHATVHGTTQGNGLYVLENPWSDAPAARTLIADSVIEAGARKGQKLGNGGFLSPELSFDGKQILFCYTDGEPQIRVWNEKTTFHIFRCNADGSRLVQLTDGIVNDLEPCWLPNGRITFISERRGGFGRCHGRPVPSFTLHTMFEDGTDIVRLSPHETNEWQPSVDNSGMIVYTRWDYVDRGFNQAHHAWTTFPDGRDARAINGNTHASQRTAPHMQMNVRAVPGSPKYVAIAAGHHTEARGSVLLIDPTVADDDAMAQVKRVTPDQLFPEAEYYFDRGSGAYAAPWPLSEKYFLCVYDGDANAQYGSIDTAKRRYAITLLDVFGNKIPIYSHPQISCLDPMPLHPRARPPVLAHATLVGRPRLDNGEAPALIPEDQLPKLAKVGLINVYNTRRPFPEGTKIKALRIWQVLPKTTPNADHPRIGMGSQKGAKLVLGTVPVEEDGSAFWEQPVNVPVLFHALDENGCAVQGMRSVSYTAPGETLMCNGCHDQRVGSARTPPKASPLAMKRAPSKIQPETDGTNPFHFARLVQPVLDAKCMTCHGEKRTGKAPDLRRGDFLKSPDLWFTSFTNLKPFVKFYDSASWTEPYTIPGQFGAKGSKLYAMLKAGHKDVKLTGDEMRRLVIWMDSNGLFHGHDQELLAQAEGKVVPPSMQ